MSCTWFVDICCTLESDWIITPENPAHIFWILFSCMAMIPAQWWLIKIFPNPHCNIYVAQHISYCDCTPSAVPDSWRQKLTEPTWMEMVIFYNAVNLRSDVFVVWQTLAQHFAPKENIVQLPPCHCDSRFPPRPDGGCFILPANGLKQDWDPYAVKMSLNCDHVKVTPPFLFTFTELRFEDHSTRSK